MLGAYRPLFETADARRLVAASVGARLAIGVFTLPLVLAVQEASGSFAVAGVATGAFSVGVALFSPLRGRAVDRRGSRTALPVLAAISAVSLMLVALLVETLPMGVVYALCFVAGTASPPLVASMRLEWQRILGVGDPRLAQAYAFESAAQTAVFVVGPLLAAAGIATVGSRVTLAAAEVALIAGTSVFAALAVVPPRPAEDGHRSPIRLPGVVTLVVATALADFALGGMDVLIPAFAVEEGHRELAGVLLAVLTLSSIAGAFAYGARSWPGTVTTHLVAVTAVGAAVVALLAAPSTIVLLLPALLLAGAPSAAQWSAASVALDRVGGVGAEAFTWLSAANSVGIAAGSAAGGAAAEAWGTSTGFLLVAAGPLAAALLLLARRGSLSPSVETVPT